MDGYRDGMAEDTPANGTRVHVRVDVPGTGAARTLPELLVAVEDVTRADAPARRVAEHVLRDVDVPPDGRHVEVDVTVTDPPDDRRRLVVRVRAGDDPRARTFTRGDLVSTTAVPVRLDGTDDVAVTLRTV